MPQPWQPHAVTNLTPHRDAAGLVSLYLFFLLFLFLPTINEKGKKKMT